MLISLYRDEIGIYNPVGDTRRCEADCSFVQCAIVLLSALAVFDSQIQYGSVSFSLA